LIGGLLGPVEIALYEIARKIPESLEMLFEAFRQVYFPFISKLFAEDKLEKATRMIQTSLRLVTFAGMFGTIIAFIFGKEILTLFFSDKYAESAPVFSILMILLTFNVIDTTLGYSIVAVGDSDKPPKINIFRTAVNFFGYLMLIPVLQLPGAALSSLIGTITVNPLNVFFLRRRKLNVQYRTFLKSVVIGVLIIGLLFAINLQSLRSKIAVLALYIITCLMFSVVTDEDIQMLAREAKTFFLKMTKKTSTQGSEIE
jgi:O-antigen/teichoic acid export membrane protein